MNETPKPAADTPASPPRYAHQQPGYYNLAWFRDNGYAEENPQPPQQDFERIAPGKFRKVYAASEKEYLYRPSRFRGFDWNMPSELLRSPEEIAKGIDRRSFEELLPQATDALGQVLLRAAAGNETALSFFVHRAYDLARQLETLQEIQPDLLRKVAETCDRWPVLLSQNKQDIDLASERVDRLRVGQRSFTAKGQRLGRYSDWLRLVAWAVDECKVTGGLVQLLLNNNVTSVQPSTRRKTNLWGAPVSVTYYRVPSGFIQITDWERKCADLALPITKDNFPQWRNAVRGFVREYWRTYETAYDHFLDLALGTRASGLAHPQQWKKLVEAKRAVEWDCRDRAFARLEKALKDYAGLRRR